MFDVQLGLQELIRTTEEARDALPVGSVNDLVKLNKSLRKLYTRLWQIQIDDTFFINEKLEKELNEERAKNEQLTGKNE